MYLSTAIAKHYRAGISPRIASQLSGMPYRYVVQQYNELARRLEAKQLHYSHDLRRVAAYQVGVRVQLVAKSDTTNVGLAKEQCKMTETYLAEHSVARKYKLSITNPTVCTLPIVLDIITKDSLDRGDAAKSE